MSCANVCDIPFLVALGGVIYVGRATIRNGVYGIKAWTHAVTFKLQLVANAVARWGATIYPVND
jgi:hypothetical protein